jgi:ABC-2 type transport system permease protein
MTIVKKEMKDQLGSRRFLILFAFMVLLSALTAYQGVNYIKDNVGASFVYIFSGARFTFSFIQIMVFFGPILGMSLGFDAINKECTNGTLSMLLGQPIYRDSVINGKFVAGTAALAIITVSTIAIMSGIAIPLIGFAPTIVEATKILTITLLTVLYLVFWLSLGILFSVIAKKASTSILFSIATWMTFSIILTILVSALANIIIPLPAGSIISGGQGGEGGQGGGFRTSPEFMETMQKRFAFQNNLLRISPTETYENIANDVLGVRGGFGAFGGGGQQFERPTSLGEALVTNWANMATLSVGLIICFSASYMLFLRTEIRPGD